jgi:hypothetical protein
VAAVAGSTVGTSNQFRRPVAGSARGLLLPIDTFIFPTLRWFEKALFFTLRTHGGFENRPLCHEPLLEDDSSKGILPKYNLPGRLALGQVHNDEDLSCCPPCPLALYLAAPYPPYSMVPAELPSRPRERRE